MTHASKTPLHNNLIDKENNFLDKLSRVDRFQYFYDHFRKTEEFLVKDNIRNSIPSGKVLNIGCGRNGTERELFPKPHYILHGVDISEESVRILQEKNLYEEVSVGDISSLSLPSNTYDIVYLRLVLHHLVYPEYLLDKGLEECFRVLKSGGILALIEPNSYHPIGAIMNIAHRLGMDESFHGTNDDIALSPFVLRQKLEEMSGVNISVHAVTYSWRRLPIWMQQAINQFQSCIGSLDNRFPYFGHTLMMKARKG